MIKGHSFYAVWDEEKGLWSKNEGDVQRIIDDELYDFKEEDIFYGSKDVKYLRDFSSNKWNEWQKYCKSLPDNYHELDEKIIFSNMKVKKTDYVSKTLNYPITEGDISAYEELMSTLYDEDERRKLEWAVGSIIKGDSKNIQKFIVLYGGPKTGKSTFLNIVEDMFPGYYSIFDSKALSSNNNNFALESFRSNPLIAIQQDGDLSRIEDNTKLNSIISHEEILVNEKFKSTYSSRFNSFLFMGTNKPVKITDAKSGIIRRLIDVSPTGNVVPRDRYDELLEKIKFEHGAIANHCLKVYEECGKSFYDKYVPVTMIGATNDFYNFVTYNFDLFLDEPEEGFTLTLLWKRYKEYCVEADIAYPFNLRVFKEEMKSYFEFFYDRYKGRRSIYVGFLKDKFKEYKPINKDEKEEKKAKSKCWIILDSEESILDKILADSKAQYANDSGVPTKKWENVKTTLKDLDTTRTHYVLPSEDVKKTLVVLDFDKKDKDGNKDIEANIKAASKWPETYAELSKGGGLHLHYFYDGDVSELNYIYDDDIEIKTFCGKSSLRRRLSKCNNIKIANISSGLPVREKKMIQEKTIKNEKHLRSMIIKNIKKEIHPNTKPSIDFIFKLLNDAYESGLHYDVTDLRPDVHLFAMNSTHNADYCLKLVSKMIFKSEEPSPNTEFPKEEDPIVFFDIESFPNLFVICYKFHGEKDIFRLINPKPDVVEDLFKLKLAGFNCRKYDNHMLYAKTLGYSVEELYNLSNRIINDKTGYFGEAYNISYVDVYDMLSPANRMSLKKWEIKLKIHHQECPYDWNQPVPEDKWEEVADYCCNDVLATEAVFDANHGDWTARCILAEWSGLTRNDTTNSHSKRIILGDEYKTAKKEFVYTDLSTIYPGYRYDPYGIDPKEYKEGTKIVAGRSIYHGLDPSEGGRVYAEPGYHEWVGLLDVESMHPTSIEQLNLFGRFTKNFTNIKDARLCIKHGDIEGAKKCLPERLHKYLKDKDEMKKLSAALKGVINPVYGLTSAGFDNELKDPRNVDNIVAKYGSLFMINLQEEVERQGYKVVHIKTDSIKIANIDDNIIKVVNDYGAKYGFKFNYEALYSKMCLVNESTYIAKVYMEDGEILKEPKWTATGAQFQVPYVFKKLFSKEPIEFYDLCETKSVSTCLYLDMNEDMDEEEHNYRFVGKTGSFCPVKPGYGGGILLRKGNDGTYQAVQGTKKSGVKDGVYRWLESETVMNMHVDVKEMIDYSYYEELVSEAIETIEKFKDFEIFVTNDSLPLSNYINVPEGVDGAIALN